MEILLERITIEEKTSLLKTTPEELELKLDLADLDSDVAYEVSHHRVEREIFLNGQVSFQLKFTCARCLGAFERRFRVPLNLVLQLVPEDRAEAVEETDDQFVLHPESKKTYDLDRHLRDLISLEVPMKPLCREDCAGLCPQCGTNLNESSCNCRVQETDSRWQGLQNLSGEN